MTGAGFESICYNLPVSNNSQKLYEEETRKVVRNLVKGYKPQKIILFGSAASGRIRQGSDIDLLIIKETKERYFDRVKKVSSLIRTPYQTDVFVLTPQELENAVSQNRFFITEEVLPKGKVVYEEKSKVRS
jgi:predicted nucleotidyltransferase